MSTSEEKDLKKTQEPAFVSKREYKKSINISWNSNLFFQLGLIIGLSFVLLIVESSWGISNENLFIAKELNIVEPPLDIYMLEKDPVIKQMKKQTKIRKANKVDVFKALTIVGNHTQKKETDTRPTEENNSKKDQGEKKVSQNLNVMNVEFAPTYPGCESLLTNKEKVYCMSEKIGNFINRKFNVEKFIEREIYGMQRIFVQFKIDSHGKVKNVMARAKDKELEIEAMKVINKLPIIEPGRQGDINVDVIYNVTILLKIDY